ncbi:hypothetical protein LG047_19405 [Methylocystis sp. WRRC1]|uniref:fibronectin type III-like domain-contianing protein n=1 Tax=Methylocystis sp. WRRC1 TaxID=1732014 RepID=UPI001D13A23C|nr:hypothetical protein [Methylocystis sp. WRRC1]
MELKAWAKVALASEQTKTITFTLTADSFCYLNESFGPVVEPRENSTLLLASAPIEKRFSPYGSASTLKPQQRRAKRARPCLWRNRTRRIDSRCHNATAFRHGAPDNRRQALRGSLATNVVRALLAPSLRYLIARQACRLSCPHCPGRFKY